MSIIVWKEQQRLSYGVPSWQANAPFTVPSLPEEVKGEECEKIRIKRRAVEKEEVGKSLKTEDNEEDVHSLLPPFA